MWCIVMVCLTRGFRMDMDLIVIVDWFRLLYLFFYLMFFDSWPVKEIISEVKHTFGIWLCGQLSVFIFFSL